MCWHLVRRNEDGYLLASLLVTAGIVQPIAENFERFYKARNGLFALYGRPECEWRFRRPPPPSHIIGCPGDTVVALVLRACDLKFTFAQPMKEFLNGLLHQARPFSRPHSIQARVILSISPAALSGTGFSPVIAFNAGNQNLPLSARSLRISGSTGGPRSMRR